MFKHPEQRINIWVNDGGLGDRIATLPAILYCLTQYPHMSCDIWVPNYCVDLYRHFLRGYEGRADVISMDRKEIMQPLPAVVFHNSYHTTLRTHLVDRAFRILNDSDDVPVTAKCYPKLRLDEIDTTKFNLEPGTYVVLTPGFTANVRKLPGATYNAIARWLTRKGITPVWLGARSDTISGGLKPESEFTEEIDYTVGRDLRDQTSLLEAGKIIALSKCIVGVDNGLLHLAGCTDVPIVAGYSSVDPKTRMPYRSDILGGGCYIVEPADYLDCKYIQTQSHFNYQADFRECLCGTMECVTSLTAEKFIEHLEEIL